MKKYIDKETGKIVNLIDSAEAKQIIGMYFEHTFGKVKMNSAKMKFLTYLSAYMKTATKDDITNIIEYLESRKTQVNLNDEAASQKYTTLMKLFKLYLDLNSDEIDIIRAYQVIATLESTKESIKESKSNGAELRPKEIMLAELMDNGFEFKSYAPEICKKWSDNLKSKMQNGEVEVSLDEEIAYQDLLDFNISDVSILTKQSDKKVQSKKSDVKLQEEIKEEKVENKAEEVKKEEVPEKRQESKVPEIVVTVPEDKKVEEQVKKEEKIQPEQISKKTQEVDLKESIDFVNQILEDKKDKDKKATEESSNNSEDDNITESTSNFSNIFRD